MTIWPERIFMNFLSREEVLSVVNEHSGKIFSCVFVKKDGTVRQMKCRTGVKKYLAGGQLAYDAIERGLLPVYEVKSGVTDAEREDSYRMINILTLISLNIGGQEYTINNNAMKCAA